ncbi:hypothetical protein GCM10025782_00030 [Pedococcus ginsenosidimutans]|uniref:Uncharacterized protein n=1 Tax=Pedococcus ginsenosidimutans TaxID=490570 RepID=A0ABP8XLD6_9MICO
MVIVAPGATDAGTVYAKSAIDMTASALSDDEEEGAVELLEPEDEGMSIDDIELEVDDDPASGVDEPQAARPSARAGMMPRRAILRVMGCLRVRRPTRRPRPGVRRHGPSGLVSSALR